MKESTKSEVISILKKKKVVGIIETILVKNLLGEKDPAKNFMHRPHLYSTFVQAYDKVSGFNKLFGGTPGHYGAFRNRI